MLHRILITGGRGFIGTNLLRELRARGHDVWTCDILQSHDEKHFKADVSSFRQMESLFSAQPFDYVYHLAAEYGRWNGEHHYENLWRTNVIGTRHLLELQARHHFRMIFFSSAEVYGDYDGLMSEDILDKIAIKQMNDYAITKWAGELQCVHAASTFGTETVRVRPVGCYGPHEYYSPYRGVIPIITYSCLKHKPFKVYGGHKRIFDYVDDTCRTFANILENFIPGEVYNIGGKEDWVTDIEQLAKIILQETGADPGLAEREASERFTTRVKTVDFSKARRDLGHDPKVDLRSGIRQYLTWMRSIYGNHP